MRGRENKDAGCRPLGAQGLVGRRARGARPRPAVAASTANCCRTCPIHDQESDDGGALDFGQGVAYLAIQKAELYEPPVWPLGSEGPAGHAGCTSTSRSPTWPSPRSTRSSWERRWPSTSPRTTSGCCSTRRATRSACTRSGPDKLRLDVGAGARLPLPTGVGGVEERRLRQQVAQHRGAAGAEQVVGDVGVLAPDVGGVLRVALAGGRQDRQVGVGERAAVRVVIGGRVALGEADQPGHLLGDGPAGKGVEGPRRRAFLGAVVAVVHGVVEPRGQHHRPAGRSAHPPAASSSHAVQDLGEACGCRGGYMTVAYAASSASRILRQGRARGHRGARSVTRPLPGRLMSTIR